MAVEIRELVIRATVRGNSAETANGEEKSDASSSGLTTAEKSEIVRAAVEQVLRILKTSKER